MVKSRIPGMEATYVAREARDRRPIQLIASDTVQEQAGALGDPAPSPEAPPGVRKPSPLHDQCLAPTPDLEGHRKRLREAFGDAMSDEFADVILGKLVEALRPSPFDQLEEATLNAGMA